MSCTKPLVLTGNGRIYPLSVEDSIQEKLRILSQTGEFIDVDGQKATIIPCGTCLGCRMDKAKEWSDRLVMEASTWPENWFVTLTFDDEHLIEQCGAYKSLDVKHIQKFMKRLRKQFCHKELNLETGRMHTIVDRKLRMFACGEYGDEKRTARPHYHLIIFNLHLPVSDLHWLKQTKQGNDLYTSDIIAKCWPYGFNTVGSVTFESCGYVSRYTMKKVYGLQGKEYYEKTHRKPPFLVMSRKPGIGFQFMTDHDWTSEPNVIVSDGTQFHECPVPKYMERYIKKTDPVLADERARLKRRLAYETMIVKHQNTDLSRTEYANQHEEILKSNTLVLTNRADL